NIEHICHCSHEICSRDNFIGYRCWGGQIWPPYDKRNAVPALINIGFMPPENITWMVPNPVELLKVCFGRTAVVGGENEDRMLPEPIFNQCAHELSNDMIHL